MSRCCSTQFVWRINSLFEWWRTSHPVFWPRKGRLWLCQLSHPAPHVTRARPPLGKELLPRGKLPSFWLAGGGELGDEEREGGPLWLVPFQAKALEEGASQREQKGVRQESTCSALSEHGLKMERGKVKLRCNSESQPLEINPPFEEITHLSFSMVVSRGLSVFKCIKQRHAQCIIQMARVKTPLAKLLSSIFFC